MFNNVVSGFELELSLEGQNQHKVMREAFLQIKNSKRIFTRAEFLKLLLIINFILPCLLLIWTISAHI
jgi:hypothetical protein